jgi:hypothetical protein
MRVYQYNIRRRKRRTARALRAKFGSDQSMVGGRDMDRMKLKESRLSVERGI